MIKTLALWTVILPLIGSLVAGFSGKVLGRKNTHRFTIALMLLAFAGACWLLKKVIVDGGHFYGPIYTWALSGHFHFVFGFMIDRLTVVMMTVVTFVSLLVHIYSIGYMNDDKGYQRFFSYMSLFTFMMLMLVTANNFFQLFLGWEGVGLVSYLLIGFWFQRPSAAQGSLKAFIVNRIGDMGLILGLAAIIDYFDSLDYKVVFSHAQHLSHQTITVFSGHPWPLSTVVCILLFIGAMGKSAQFPLHVWLPASMEGPTPISALIHAATMVTAGVFMVARLSPLYQLSTTALSVVLIVGATGALFLGLLAFVEFDIKRVIAYSTMSQLGYMMAANGAAAFSVGIFHLLTHACFKALLFLCAGSVIIALHHEQDMRKMGGLWRKLPITYVCFLIGSLALVAMPPFSGFYSKDLVIDAVKHSAIPGAKYAYACLLLGAFVTAYYIFRTFFMTFHGKSRFSLDPQHPVKESRVMCWPLILLAIPSIAVGWYLFGGLFKGNGWLGSAIAAQPHHAAATFATDLPNAMGYALHALTTWPFILTILGIVLAWFNTLYRPEFARWLQSRFSWVHLFLKKEYGIEGFYNSVIVGGFKRISEFSYKVTDVKLIDNGLVNNSGRGIKKISQYLRLLQTGYLYHYVLFMMVGFLGFLIWGCFQIGW
jgi:NADH-quinone oxidoreductase subunit L